MNRNLFLGILCLVMAAVMLVVGLSSISECPAAPVVVPATTMPVPEAPTSPVPTIVIGGATLTSDPPVEVTG